MGQQTSSQQFSSCSATSTGRIRTPPTSTDTKRSAPTTATTSTTTTTTATASKGNHSNNSNTALESPADAARGEDIEGERGMATDSEALYEAALQHYFKRDELPRFRAEDRRLRSEEGIDNYGVGGYHRVHRGQLYNGRYLILSKLGWGHFSTVWLTADLHRALHDTHRHVALKVQKGEPSYLEAALDEVKLLQRVRDRSLQSPSMPGEDDFSCYSFRLAQMLDSFLVVGPNGKHMCTVFEVLGENLLQLLKRSPTRRLPVASVKRIARDVLLGLDYLHRKCQIIHTDLKPENVLVARSDTTLARGLASGTFASASGKHGHGGSQHSGKSSAAEALLQDLSVPVVKIADLGNACWTDHHFTDYITTRQYRAPEIIMQAPYSCPADMWSLACLVFELLTGEYLFDPKQSRSKGYSRNDDHLALMLELMGPAPPSLLRHAKCADHYFDSAGRLRRLPNLDYWPLHDLLQCKYKFDASFAHQFASFLRPMLQLDPNKRASAAEQLAHPWLRLDLPFHPAPKLHRPLSAFVSGRRQHLDAKGGGGGGGGGGLKFEAYSSPLVTSSSNLLKPQPQLLSQRPTLHKPVAMTVGAELKAPRPQHLTQTKSAAKARLQAFTKVRASSHSLSSMSLSSPVSPVTSSLRSSRQHRSSSRVEGQPDNVVLDLNVDRLLTQHPTPPHGRTPKKSAATASRPELIARPRPIIASAAAANAAQTAAQSQAQQARLPLTHGGVRVWRPAAVQQRVSVSGSGHEA